MSCFATNLIPPTLIPTKFEQMAVALMRGNQGFYPSSHHTNTLIALRCIKATGAD
jgi:hypothetical protein